MLACLVENPLVAMVVSPWLMASNHPMPHIFKDIVHAVVSNMYIPKIHRLTPVDSAAKSWTLSMPNMGRIATVKNTIPNPPSHCVRLRQRSRACGWLSILSRIDAPVVVNPDMDSKKASVKLGICPPSQ